MAEYGWADFIRDQQAYRIAFRRAHQLSNDRLKKIKAYRDTKRIRYPEFKEAFDYVHSIYPLANVKQALVYKCPKPFLKEVGYGGVGGFYDTSNKVVVVTDCLYGLENDEFQEQAVFTVDEVLCHELIHYCANFNTPVSTRNVEEEIAYGKSIEYLRSKGRNDDFIVEKNMLPYLLSVVDRAEVYKKVLTRHYKESELCKISRGALDELLRSLEKEVRIEMRKAAVKMGHKMLDAYGGREPIYSEVKQVKKLILDDFD